MKITIYVLVVASVFFIIVIFNLRDAHKKQMVVYEKEISSLGKKIEVISSARTAIQQALRKSISKKMEYRASWQDEKKRRQVIDAQLQAVHAEREAAALRIKSLEDENRAFKNRIVLVEQEKQKIEDSLQRKIKRLLTRTNIELGQVVITPEHLRGTILKANREYNFVIIDLGRNDGIKTGMTFTAFRQDKETGELMIEKVYDELSVAKPAFKWIGDELAAGDIIKGM